MNEEDWRNHVLEGSTKGVDEKQSGAIIKGWLEIYRAEADAALKTLRAAMESDAEVKTHQEKAETLLRRWAQIKRICESAAESVGL